MKHHSRYASAYAAHKARSSGSLQGVFLAYSWLGTAPTLGIMENEMETTTLYWGYNGLYRDNGK